MFFFEGSLFDGNAPKTTPPLVLVLTGSISYFCGLAFAPNKFFTTELSTWGLFKLDEFYWNNPTCTILLSGELFAPIFFADPTTWLSCIGTYGDFSILLFSSPYFLSDALIKVFSNLSLGYSTVFSPVFGLCLLIFIIFLLAICSGD